MNIHELDFELDASAGIRITRRAALRGSLAIPALIAISACATPTGMASKTLRPAASKRRDDEIAAFLSEAKDLSRGIYTARWIGNPKA